MSEDNANLALLPSGFVDLLPPDAEDEARCITSLMKRFAAFGYSRIKPPFLEFEESLLAPGPGSFLAQNTFRLMDPVSHRMVGMRPDITAQVARIASSRLKNEPRPLRLAYANDVLRTRAGQMRTERQFCQVGCEIVGDGSVDTDVEICMLPLIGLKGLGLDEITIDLNIPGFVSRLIACEGEEMPEETLAAMRKAIAQRDRDALEALGSRAALRIAQAMDAAGNAAMALERLQGIALSDGPDHGGQAKTVERDILTLEQVCEDLKRALEQLDIRGVSITVDVMDQAGFEYHKGLGFTLFSPHVHGELGRGGCYDVRWFGNSDAPETARGFTLYMDTIRKVKPEREERDRVYVSAHESWATIRDLQDKGWIVVRGSAEHNFPEGCSHQYVNGTVVGIK